jgi:CRISPR-associated protein Csd1
MILKRLYELAERSGLLADPAFEDVPVPYVVVVGAGGEFLGVEQRRNVVRKRDKETYDKGVLVSAPVPHGNTANKGFARYFVDTLPRVLPVVLEEKVRAKADASRKTFWEQVEQAAGATNDPALQAVAGFGRRLGNEPLVARVLAELAEKKAAPSDRVTFAWQPGGEATILSRPAVRAWYRGFREGLSQERRASGAVGLCQITGTIGPIPRTHPIRLSGIPGGLPTGASLISFDKDAFGSYDLDGAANACVGERAAEGYSRALKALIEEKLPGSPRSRLYLGEVVGLFWTRQGADAELSVLEEPTTESVERLFRSVGGGKEAGEVEPDDFYLLLLSGNSARVIVRDYLETPLLEARHNVRKWFRGLTIASRREGEPTCLFPLWQLARATALDKDHVAPDTPTRLLAAALGGGPLPGSVLTACLGRLRVEGSEGFVPSRLALIKLILSRMEVPVSEALNPEERSPAYVYGRLLAVFDEIQYAALGSVNASVVDRFYGTLSAAPGMVLARLYANARHHLRKVRSEKKPLAISLENRLAAVTKLLPSDKPRGVLSLQDQGQFALGFYHQKAHRAAERAEAKRRREAAKAGAK